MLLITVWRVTCAVNYIPMCHEILPIFARRIKRPFIRLGTRLGGGGVLLVSGPIRRAGGGEV